MLNTKPKDSGSKFILEDPILCSQFLRRFVPLWATLLNKLQSPEDIGEFHQLSPEKVEFILQNTPEYLLEKIAVLFRAFLAKLNVPMDEAEEIVGMVKERKVAEMFADMEKMDIQEERRKTAEARRELEEAKREADESIRKAIEEAEEAKSSLTRELAREQEKAVKALLDLCREAGYTKELSLEKLQEKYSLSKEEAVEMTERYW